MSEFRRVDTLHVRTGFTCQNDCVFCCDGGYGKHLDPPSLAVAERIIDENPESGIVEFTMHEPTLNRDLAQLARRARQRGYDTVSVVTNGRRLKDPAFVAQLIEAGINRFQISMHGHAAWLHDAITRKARSFEQALAGIENVQAGIAASGGRVRLILHSTIVAKNTPHLADLIPFALGLRPEHYGLNMVFLTGSALENIDDVAVRYSDVTSELARALPAAQKIPVTVSEMPPCQLIGKIPRQYFGIREDCHYVKTDAEGRVESFVAKAGTRGFAFGEPCEHCQLRTRCDGVPPGYVDRFGWSEFESVTRSDLEALNFTRESELRELLAPRNTEWSILEIHTEHERAEVRIRFRDSANVTQLLLEPRDEASPAYRRTSRFNVSMKGKGHGKAERDGVERICRLIESRA